MNIDLSIPNIIILLALIVFIHTIYRTYKLSKRPYLKVNKMVEKSKNDSILKPSQESQELNEEIEVLPSKYIESAKKQYQIFLPT